MSTWIAGVSMTPFSRAGQSNPTYVQVGSQAIREALKDGMVNIDSIDAVVASYNYGDPVSGHRVCLEAGVQNVPIYNINGYCSAGSVALNLARKLVLSGQHKCVLAVGFDQMERGLVTKWDERPSTVELHVNKLDRLGADPGVVKKGMTPFTSHVIKMFAYAAREYFQKYPKTEKDILAKIALKNRVHGSFNPRALLSVMPTPRNVKDMSGHLIFDPIYAEASAPTATGSAAAVVVSKDWLDKNAGPVTKRRAVEMIAQEVVTDKKDTLQNSSFMDLVGYEHAREAATRCYDRLGIRPYDVDVVELHDCFAVNELFMLEALGFAKPGEGSQLIDEGVWKTTAAGGRQFQIGGPKGVVVNPSGGLESKGHPIGATGIAQCAELVWQLRNEAGKRQVAGAKLGLQHNFGLGSTCVVTMYQSPPAAANL